jgi:hypothetical protein
MAHLRPDSARRWGVMNPAQALAQCSAQTELVLGLEFPPRSLIGRLVGRFAKFEALNEKPIRRNMPTDKIFVVSHERDLLVERQRLSGLINRLVEGGLGHAPSIPTASSGP